MNRPYTETRRKRGRERTCVCVREFEQIWSIAVPNCVHMVVRQTKQKEKEKERTKSEVKR